MNPARQADPDLDALTWQLTTDANDEDQQLMGFENASDEANPPMSRNRPWRDTKSYQSAPPKTAANRSPPSQLDGHDCDIALLDIDFKTDSETSRLIAAYRRWTHA
jgi:hypothetical protein